MITGEGPVIVEGDQAAASGYTAGSKQATFSAVQAANSSKLAATVLQSDSGAAASLIATISPQYSGQLTGSISFYDGMTKLATIALSGGTANYTTGQLVGAQHSFSATYSGDVNFIGSTSNTVAVTLSITSVSLQLAATNLVYPLPPAFEIIVSPAGGKLAPTGTVSLYDGGTVVGKYPLYAITKGYLVGLVLPSLNVGTHFTHSGLLGRRQLRARHLNDCNRNGDTGSGKGHAELPKHQTQARPNTYLHGRCG